MRLLLEDQANDVIIALDQVFLNQSVNPFAYNSLNTRILSGEEEGVFAWIAANYLRGFFNANSKALKQSYLLKTNVRYKYMHVPMNKHILLSFR